LSRWRTDYGKNETLCIRICSPIGPCLKGIESHEEGRPRSNVKRETAYPIIEQGKHVMAPRPAHFVCIPRKLENNQSRGRSVHIIPKVRLVCASFVLCTLLAPLLTFQFFCHVKEITQIYLLYLFVRVLNSELLDSCHAK
jgi:hypothetical protein